MINQCRYLINKMINVCPKKETPDSTVLERFKCGFLRLQEVRSL